MQTNTSIFKPVVAWPQVILFSSLIFYWGKMLFIPLFFGLLIAIIMYPISKWLEGKGWSKILSITACLLIVAVLFAALLALLVWQLKVFSKDAPIILKQIESALQDFQQWLTENTKIKMDLQNTGEEKLTSALSSLLRSGLHDTVNTLFILFLTPVYTALFMYHRRTGVQFLKSVIPARYQPHFDVILKQTIHTYFNYIRGMVLVYLIVGVLNSIGLLALGVNHAILFGMLCAIMTIIPYIGIFVSAMLPISVVWIETGNIWYPLGVVAVFGLVQYLEANVIFPKVVGTQLNVSTLAMLVAVIAGGIIWGVAGMVLFIPFVAILKIISDHIEEWKPVNLLLSRK